MDYIKAPQDMVYLCRELIEKHHPHLDGVKIALICQDKARTSCGKTVLAYASKPSKRLQPLLDDNYHFIICVALKEWELLSLKQRAALLDHELCHCIFDDYGQAKLRGHDLEEFACIIERHGFWRGDSGEDVVKQAILLTQGITVTAPELKFVKEA